MGLIFQLLPLGLTALGNVIKIVIVELLVAVVLFTASLLRASSITGVRHFRFSGLLILFSWVVLVLPVFIQLVILNTIALISPILYLVGTIFLIISFRRL
mgnify:CR=1 FL=1